MRFVWLLVLAFCVQAAHAQIDPQPAGISLGATTINTSAAALLASGQNIPTNADVATVLAALTLLNANPTLLTGTTAATQPAATNTNTTVAPVTPLILPAAPTNPANPLNVHVRPVTPFGTVH